MIKKKEGFTVIEIIISMLILAIVSICSLGGYTAFLDNSDDITTMINSKINITKMLGQKTPLNGYKNGVIPYLKFDNDQLTYLQLDNDNVTLISNTLNYNHQRKDNSIKVIFSGSGLVNNTVYFNSQGKPIDQNGNNVSFTINVRKTLFDKTIQQKELKIDKMGTVTISNL